MSKPSTLPWHFVSKDANPHSHSSFDIYGAGATRGSGRIAHIPATETKPTRANAEFIVAACNAHDELVRQRDHHKESVRCMSVLFDELAALVGVKEGDAEGLIEKVAALVKAQGVAK